MASSSVSPRVSVIVGAYNAAADIRATLESLEAQTFSDFEVIVVDDGSTDQTGAIIGEFTARDRRFRLIHQSNQGVGAARNTAIRVARGTLIAPLDADDTWEPEKLAKQVDAIDHAGPDVGLIYCWSRRIDERGKVLTHGHPYTVEGRIHRALLLHNIVGNASVPLFRASALADVGLYLTRDEQQGAQGCEDWDLNLRVSERYLARLVPKYLVGYRQKGSCMSVNAAGMSQSYETTLQRAQRRMSQVPSAMFRWSAGYFYLYLASKSYQWQNYPWTLRSAWRAVRSDPVLLLSSRLRRFALGSAVHVMTGNRLRRRRGGGASDLVATRTSAPQETGQLGLLERIQLRRWMTACSG